MGCFKYQFWLIKENDHYITVYITLLFGRYLMKDPLNRSDFKCDYPGCRLLPFAEVFPSGKEYWGYLCLLHFSQEYVIRKIPMGWCVAEWISRLPLASWLWNFYCIHS